MSETDQRPPVWVGQIGLTTPFNSSHNSDQPV